ncbi:GTP cyclohydrolase II [Candidatus Micrarchaeota archaeon]|nr:GTP cyclohydrolase II [Candidatus Micrarchaeota archaeon]
MLESLSAELPTREGKFKVIAFKNGEREHLVISKGKISGEVIVRIHSKCVTGDVFHSKRCDCREQLEKSLEIISREGGVIIYLDQEGRGIGLFNKINAYALQDLGRDTFQANRELGFQDDERNYEDAIEILKKLKISKIVLITNNELKIQALQNHGFQVRVLKIKSTANKFNKQYLKSKKEKNKKEKK